MNTKVEITKHPFGLQGVDGALLFYTKVITSRNRMQSYEMIPISKYISVFR